jgi:hypothetical protein
MQITLSTLLVLVIGFAVGQLLVGMFSGAKSGLNAPTLALIVCALIWLLRVGPRPDMPFSLIGMGGGVGVSLLIPQVAFKTLLEPGVSVIGALLLLALAA